ncbi:release factor glutamine methyltransferase [Desulfosarcina widdelii]|uniref:Release factor glutamine methyltransferase n=1 Tax=Desulfosarcina widdelii TaxID=947919 RepID=A0A5K7ZEQ0_9BACT|nr:peptide chain release factor N(5)-glutamine methyltransferase [Desulfosarcina widdelii]BBO79285.1 release factor glutamine methyltransferase [Desulfosarcina widdelii]
MPEPETWTLLRLVRWTTGYFQEHDIESARSEAEILLAHCLGMRRIDLYLNHDKPLTEAELANFKALIKRRIARVPLAYITGSREFWSLPLAVGPSVLIPRPETECLVEAVLPVLDDPDGQPKRVLDLGTGSGAITIALAHEHPEHCYVAMDRYPSALKIARQNARTHRVDHCIQWFCGDFYASLADRGDGFDLIVSNPPYICSGDMAALQPEIRLHEPVSALDGGEDGLLYLRQIIASSHDYLKGGGLLALEMGCDQADAVRSIANDVGCYVSVRVIKDYSGLDRIAVMEKISES